MYYPDACEKHHWTKLNRYVQCFFMDFKRVSWWSFRVSIPFHFHKNASFRPNMLNYLNTTFTFGKQTKWNFINRKVQCRPTYAFHLLIFVPAFPFGRAVGAAALGGSEIPHDQQQSQIVLLAPHRDGTKQGRRCNRATWSLDKFWVAFPCV